MNLLGKVHGKAVHSRRVRQLCRHLGELLPKNAKILDVGCGDGMLTSLIQKERPDVEARGIDVFVREKTLIPVEKFDGSTIPYPDKSFDVVMFVDVLHHTDDPFVLLREAARVAKNFVVLKDHTDDGFLSNATLKFMDWVGNKPHGVVLPYNYWKESQWKQAFEKLQMEILDWRTNLKLYPRAADLFFGRNLHMVARLKVK
jgi:ubiquinone/menaquinone biosynthesis C-methylase UbiE